MFYDDFIKGVSFVRKRYHISFITHFCGSVIAGGCIAISLFYSLTYKELGDTYYQSLLTLQGLRGNMLQGMVLVGGAVAILVTLAVLAVTLIGSHRIAGPVYRLERAMKSLGNGDVGFKVRFRRHDAIEGMADEVNSAIESLNSRVSFLVGGIKGVREELERVKANPDQPTAILAEKVRLLKKAVSEFKTG